MRNLSIVALFALAACGGEEPAPAPAPAPAPEAAPKEAKAKAEEPKAEAVKPADFAAMSPEDQKAYLMKLGEEVYTTGGSGGVACVTCHQANGQGLPPSFPPLKGSGEFYGDCVKHAGFVVKGLTGEVEVQGVKYNSAMPAQANLSDLEIAAAITYERNSWGNDDGVCMPKDVKAAREG